MADGELTLKLDDETVRRLTAAADAMGQSASDYAASLVSDGLSFDRLSLSQRALAEFDETGVSYDAETALQEFQANVAARVSKA